MMNKRPPVRTTAPESRGPDRSAPAIRAEHLTVVRGSRTVIDDLTFEVAPASVTGLLGPSGCGKSTLMRAIVGTQAKVTGTLDVLGRPAGEAPRCAPASATSPRPRPSTAT